MTLSIYTEKEFEDHIEARLIASGYHARPASAYDPAACLLPADVLAFIQASQPEAYQKLSGHLGPDADAKILTRLSNEIAKHGALHVLRKGFKTHGAHFRMAFFQPVSGMNPEAMALFQKNRLSVARQLPYSLKNSKTLDMALFLNGVPIITLELKNALTGQFAEDAQKQYCRDRDPKEPLFKFKRCLVHFAVGTEKVFMTTRLQGAQTRFLPFNRDFENPVNPHGLAVAYLWEDILQPATLLNLIKSYLHVQPVTEKYYDAAGGSIKERRHEVFIFPRYHQLDAVRKLLRAVKQEGAGRHYLIQHSAGSGKSNSIAWLAHQLAGLYQSEADTQRLFDSVVVVTDRRVLDRQLQDTITQFEQTRGVVKPIDKNAAQLRQALAQGKDIIITTLQKFPVISADMSQLQGKRFAVIIDEAHSSQSGESAKHLKKVLHVSLEQAEAADQDDFDLQEEILKEINYRGRQPHISYFAFTATPKGKTLELFGRPDSEGRFRAFHTYSMRQAIQERFILDVLKNYTTFKRYFKLVKKAATDQEVEKSKALKLLMSYVDLHPHEIEMKTRIMLEHFGAKTMQAIQGRGRAMLVTRSRLHAARYFLAFQKIMAEQNLGVKPLVAFSGTVKDPGSGALYTEANLNQLPHRVSIVNAFKTPDYRILIAANKFQAGFDEPLLHTMYVDKQLGGVNAVQTLSRLNRTARGKTDCMILDFVNDVEDIRAAFQDYYQATFLEEATDPDKLYDLQTELESPALFTSADIDAFARIFFNPVQANERLQPLLDAAVARWNALDDDNQREDFRAALQSYIRLYGYISQIITFTDADLEKLYVFAMHLNRKLPKRKSRLPYEITEAIDLDAFRVQETYSGYHITLETSNGAAKGIKLGAPQHSDDEKDLLSNIIHALNEAYGVELTEDDQIDMRRLHDKLDRHEELKAVLTSDNTPENMRYMFDKVVDELLLDFVHTKIDLYKKLTDPKVNDLVKAKWFAGCLEASREAGVDGVEAGVGG